MSWPRLVNGVADDIDEAVRQFCEKSVPFGNAFLDALELAFIDIEHAPRLHARLETNFSNREIRRVILHRFNYLVVYRVVGDAPHVLAVMHASRQPDAWRSRDEDA